MRTYRPYLAALGMCVAATAAMVVVGQELGPAAVALVYLLVVFVSAIWFGRAPGIISAVLALLGLDYVFTSPYTLLITSIREGVSLLAFLVVAEVTSGLVIRAREKQAEAEVHAWEREALHAVSDAMSLSILPEEILRTLPDRIVAIVGVPWCAIYLADGAGTLYLYASAGTRGAAGASTPVPSGAVHAFVGREPVNDAALFVPLGAGTRTVGVLQAELGEPGARSDATQRLLMTLAIHIAAVIERVRLWREAAEAEMLRKTNELKSSLLSAVSHDLRTPLFSIRVAATALQKKDVARQPRVRHELLESIDSEAARLSRLVGNLLDLSRIEAGVLRPAKAWHDLQEVIARAIDRPAEGLPGRHAIVTKLPDDLPLIGFDFTQIEDVLLNLLDNARRHSPEGGAIHIAAYRRDSEVIVQVENEGPAIPAADAERVFDRFYTIPGSGGSSGLGLAICKGLVEAHGGRIWVERPGEPGARLAFALPVDEIPFEVGEQPPARTG